MKQMISFSFLIPARIVFCLHAAAYFLLVRRASKVGHFTSPQLFLLDNDRRASAKVEP